MAMPASGNIAILDNTLQTCSSISCAVCGNNTPPKCLTALGASAGFSAPYCMSDFYGYSNAATYNININASWCGAEGCLCGQVQLKCCTGTCLCGKSISTKTTTLTSFTNILNGCYYIDFNNVVGLDGSMQQVTTYGCWSDCYNSCSEGKCTCSFACDNNIIYDLYDAIF